MKKVGKLPCGRPVPDWLESKHSSKEKRLERLTAKLDAFVSTQKLNKSHSRVRVLEIATAFETHFTPADLIARVANKYPKIGAATVYRCIQIFSQSGILRETLAKDTGERVYEIESTHHHDHIICLDCDAILEFHEPQIEVMQQKILKKLGFCEEKHRHVIYARCQYRKA